MAVPTNIFAQSAEQMTALGQSWLKVFGVYPYVHASSILKLYAGTMDNMQQLYASAAQHPFNPTPAYSRKLADLQCALLQVMAEGASAHAESWDDLADKIDHCYAQYSKQLSSTVSTLHTPAEAPAPTAKAAPAKTSAAAG